MKVVKAVGMLTTLRLLLLVCFHWNFLPCSAVSPRRNQLEHVVVHRAGPWNQSLQIGQAKPSEVSPPDAELRSTGHVGTRRTPGTTISSASITGYIQKYEEICALWDSSCTGSEESAFNIYYDNLYWDEAHFCNPVAMKAACMSMGESLPYQCVQFSTCTPCLSDAPQTSKLAVQKMMSFARSPKCSSMLWNKACSGNLQTDDLWCTYQGADADGPCAGACFFSEAVVELFYWPVEDNDISCLNIIGEAGQNDIDPVTHAEGFIGWGCTTLSTAQNGSIASGYLMTATQTSADKHFTYKQELFDPWNMSMPCVASSARSPRPQTPSTGLSALQIRAHAFVNSTQITAKENHTSVRVAVSNGVTFTSPSIYMKLVEISVTDNIGVLGPTRGFPILAFTPGELSSFVGDGRPGNRNHVREFNVADLPCPPMSVMRENWYRPAPGHPYQPRIAFPSKFRSLYSAWQTCSGDLTYFTAFDPPRSLTPASRMAPETTADPLPTSSRRLDPLKGPQRSHTSHGNGVPAVPAATPSPDQPRRTTSPLIVQSSAIAKSPGDPNPGLDPGVLPGAESNTKSNEDLGTRSTRPGLGIGSATQRATASAVGKPEPQPADFHTLVSETRRGRPGVGEASNFNKQSSIAGLEMPSQGIPDFAFPGSPFSQQAAHPKPQPENSGKHDESRNTMPSGDASGSPQHSDQKNTIEQKTNSIRKQSPAFGRQSSLGVPDVVPIQSSGDLGLSTSMRSRKSRPIIPTKLSKFGGTEPLITGGPVSREPPSKVPGETSDSNDQQPLVTAGGPALGLSNSAAAEGDPGHNPSVPFRSALFGSTDTTAEAQGSVPVPQYSSIDTKSISASSTPIISLGIQGATLSIQSGATQTLSRAAAGGNTISSPLAVTIGSKTITLEVPPYTPEATRLPDSPTPLLGSDVSRSKGTGEHNSVIATFGTRPVTAVPHAVVIDGKTLTPGASALTVSGTSVSLASSALVIGTNIIPFLPASDGSNIATLGNNPIAVQSHGILVAGSTLIVGGPAFTISGTEISLQSTALLLGTRTISLPSTSKNSDIIATVGTNSITALPHAVVVAGSTLTPDGSALTISGMEVSLDSTALLIGSSTIVVPTASSNVVPIPTILGGKQTIAVPSGNIVVDGLTLRPDSSGITVSGVTMSLNSHSEVVVEFKTTSSFPQNRSTTGVFDHPSQSRVPNTPATSSTATESSNSLAVASKPSTGVLGLVLALMTTVATLAT